MVNDNKVRIYNRLFFKLYRNYALMLIVTAALIGFIFMWQFQVMTKRNIISELKDQARVVSGKTTDYIKDNDENIYQKYLEYISSLKNVNNWDVWTCSNPDAEFPMKDNMVTGDRYEDILKMPEYAQYIPIIQNAFKGIIDSEESYDKIYELNMITVGYPIKGKNGEVVGALLVKQPYSEQREIVSNSLYLIVLSIVISLGISFVIVIIFATELSIPISRMRVTALELAAGNYQSKTGIKRNDEIGDLAKTVDILSEKLLENETERKKLDQMRLDFFANVSHELRTPITVIRAYTEALSDGVVQDRDKVEQYHNRMLSECKSMERLVGDLLTLSKMQNPDFAIEKEPVNIQQVFDDIMRSASTIAEKKNIAIEVTKDSPSSLILGDYDRIRQMFMVILDNAIKFSGENKMVHINLSKTDKIKVSIIDEGVGIDAADISNIFEKFYKSNLRQNASGTGLGLAIAKQIALKHDGTIEVNSTPGVGSEFIFTFPLLEL
jgi:Signal transduction histidine kinase